MKDYEELDIKEQYCLHYKNGRMCDYYRSHSMTDEPFCYKHGIVSLHSKKVCPLSKISFADLIHQTVR